MSNKLVTARYDALLEDIAGIFNETRKALAEAYWRIGERMVRVWWIWDLVFRWYGGATGTKECRG